MLCQLAGNFLEQRSRFGMDVPILKPGQVNASLRASWFLIALATSEGSEHLGTQGGVDQCEGDADRNAHDKPEFVVVLVPDRWCVHGVPPAVPASICRSVIRHMHDWCQQYSPAFCNGRGVIRTRLGSCV